METTDKAANSAHESFDKFASTTNQAAEKLGEKDVHLKYAEQQLMENCRAYVHDNPNIAGYRGGDRISAEPRVERPLDRQTS